MIKVDKILENVLPINHCLNEKSKKQKIYLTGKMFRYKSIFILLEHVKYLIENKIELRQLNIIVNVKYISDEATLIIFETIIYYLLKNNVCDVLYTFIVDKNLLGYEHFKNSNLFKYNTKKIIKEDFINLYETETFMNGNHFRKICIDNEENEKGLFLSVLISEITDFLSTYNIEESYAEELSEVITEIVGNSLEHSDGDCILDIKVAIDEIRKYKSINVTTITISDILIGSNVKKYIGEKNKELYSPRNEIVLKAYKNHQKQFSKNYDINTFSTISAFQKYVTTRENSLMSGGTGLTTLIKQLKSKAKEDYCYVLSGNDIIFFNEHYLDLTEDGLIGFNESNNYLSDKPSSNIVYKNKNKFNGTIYNLSFILEERSGTNE